MLQALLHGKLDESTPEPQRLEDALTSTVFGTLISVDAWYVLAQWFSIVSECDTSPTHVDAWFWPRLTFAEPDIVLRLGRFLIVVEAKYRSNRNDRAPDNPEETDLCDQIFRQHLSITTALSHRGRYTDFLEDAIRECELVQIFAVDARRRKRAEVERIESASRLPTQAVLRLVTWQDLYSLLNAPDVKARRWATDLRTYLEYCGLDSFQGIGRYMAPPASTQHVCEWAVGLHRQGLCEAIWSMHVTPSRAVYEWRSPKRESETGRLGGHDSLSVIARTGDVLLEWRQPNGSLRHSSNSQEKNQ